MDIVVLFFLTSGLFLGWSLGANDAANVFGTAVGTRMVKFTTAALVCSVFVVLGAVFSGAGAAHTLGKLGSINALPGSFMAALSAALTVYWMTKLGLPVSTSQAIVGAIIGWNLFSGSVSDMAALFKILGTWVACPLLAGVIGATLFKMTDIGLRFAKLHLLRLDAYTRVGLILAGAFGSYSLGANNIANVMGVFVPSSPFTDFNVMGLFSFSGIQQLFLIGAIAIGVGVFTYSKKVMLTVGGDLLPLSPVAAFIVVTSHSIVLFLFASEGLEHLLASAGLPTIPLVPVSSSQAVVGAVIGIGLLKGGRNIQWRVLANIAGGWVSTPLISAAVCFTALFFLQNVFNQQVYAEVHYRISPPVAERMVELGLPVEDMEAVKDVDYPSAFKFLDALEEVSLLSGHQEKKALELARVTKVLIDPATVDALNADWLSAEQVAAVGALTGKRFEHKWILAEELAWVDTVWRSLPDTKVNKAHNKKISQKLDFICRTFALVE
jgi:inorganic phosphate transporter, PiT family